MNDDCDPNGIPRPPRSIGDDDPRFKKIDAMRCTMRSRSGAIVSSMPILPVARPDMAGVLYGHGVDHVIVEYDNGETAEWCRI